MPGESLESMVWSCVKRAGSIATIIALLWSPTYLAGCTDSGKNDSIFKKYDFSTPEGAIHAYYNSIKNEDVDVLLKLQNDEDNGKKRLAIKRIFDRYDPQESANFAYITNGRPFDECYIEIRGAVYAEIIDSNSKFVERRDYDVLIYDKKTNEGITSFKARTFKTKGGEWVTAF